MTTIYVEFFVRFDDGVKVISVPLAPHEKVPSTSGDMENACSTDASFIEVSKVIVMLESTGTSWPSGEQVRISGIVLFVSVPPVSPPPSPVSFPSKIYLYMVTASSQLPQLELPKSDHMKCSLSPDMSREGYIALFVLPVTSPMSVQVSPLSRLLVMCNMYSSSIKSLL